MALSSSPPTGRYTVFFRDLLPVIVQEVFHGQAAGPEQEVHGMRCPSGHRGAHASAPYHGRAPCGARGTSSDGMKFAVSLDSVALSLVGGKRTAVEMLGATPTYCGDAPALLTGHPRRARHHTKDETSPLTLTVWTGIPQARVRAAQGSPHARGGKHREDGRWSLGMVTAQAGTAPHLL